MRGSKLIALLVLLSGHAFVTAGLVGCDLTEPHHENSDWQRLSLPLLPEFDALNERIFKPLCVDCHSGLDAPHGILLTSYEEIVNSDRFPPLVTPGSPENSSLYTSCADGSMPEKRPRLRQEELATLYEWIKNGALKTPVQKAEPPTKDDQASPDDGGQDDLEPDDDFCSSDEPCNDECLPDEPC